MNKDEHAAAAGFVEEEESFAVEDDELDSIDKVKDEDSESEELSG